MPSPQQRATHLCIQTAFEQTVSISCNSPLSMKGKYKTRQHLLIVVDNITVMIFVYSYYHCMYLASALLSVCNHCPWHHRGDMMPEQAVQLYTGQHWRVPASLLSRMSHFAKYAVAVYGLEPHSHKESRFTNALMAWLRKSKEQVTKAGLSGWVPS